MSFKQKILACELKDMQALPLDIKIKMSLDRIQEWYEYWNGKVYIAFSGGKDSTVMADLIWSLYPDVPGVFYNTGLEYPEILSFVKTFDNIVWVRPKMSFHKVIKEHGYPVIGKLISYQLRNLQNPSDSNKATRNLYLTGIKKGGAEVKSYKLNNKWKYLIDAPFKISEKCCNKLKKEPAKIYEKETGRKSYIGTMASDSRLRRISYMVTGCNVYKNTLHSMPLSLWLEKDIWQYIKQKGLKYSKIYDMGWQRTSCMFCMFGIHMEKYPNRFQRMKHTHPKQYDYCMNKLGLKEVLEYIKIPYNDHKLMPYL